MKHYKCVKEVLASQILKVQVTNTIREKKARFEFMNTEGERVSQSFPIDIIARGTPEEGDYLVLYNAGTKDEYASWSPKAVFEDGYECLEEDIDVDDDDDADDADKDD